MNIINSALKVVHFIRDLALLKKWSNLKEGNIKFDYKNYELTWDVLGIRLKYPPDCVFCWTEMIIRYSQLHWSPELKNENFHIDLAYKCPQCDWFTVFGVPLPKQYFLYIWQLRQKKGIGNMYTPAEEWMKHKEIKKRLKQLGYW